MSQYVYSMNRVGKIVPPKKQILRDISLHFFPGAKIGVLGYNGAGKSTLLRIMAGIDTDIVGEAQPQPGLNIGYLPQEPQLDPAKDVRGNVEDGVAETKALLDRFNAVSEAMADPDADFDALMAEQGELQDKIDAADAWELDRKLEQAAHALNLPPWEADVEKLSGGERRRVALCRLLLSEPDMLLLDEPTNHLDADSVAWLESFLCDFKGTVVAVTHDRYFLDNAAGWILELDRGHGIPWEGNYSSWLEQKEKRLAQEEKTEAARQKAMAEELEWVRSNPKGRQSKSKARLKQFEEMQSQEFQRRAETREIYIPPGPRLGEQVFELEGVSKAYGDRVLYQDVSLQIPRGAIVGIIGHNGAGKTTLFRMLTGQEQPDSGTITVGESVDIAYVDQSRDDLDGKKTVWEEVSEGQDILLIGETILDEYQYVNPMQKSAKENVLAVLYQSKELFAGGVLAAANHLAGFCKQVDVITCIGQDGYEDFVRKHVRDNVNLLLHTHSSRPTIRKRRYVERPDFVYSKIADRLCEMGRYGQKTGAGWYRYEAGSRTPRPDPAVEQMIEDYSAELGVTRRPISDDEIVGRCVYALVQEGARILADGIAQRASDIDVVWLNGYGFPKVRGGPMFHADTQSLFQVRRVVRGFARIEHGDPAFWEPAPLLNELANAGKTFN